jgi:hypothetical protein
MTLTGLVLGPGPAGRCDNFRVGGGVVVRDRDGLWRMWYYCRDRAFDPAAPATLGTGRIAHAVSSDGRAWRRINGPASHGAVLDPDSTPQAFDSVHVGVTDVSRVGTAWWMWTFGGDATPRDTAAPGFRNVIGLGMRCGLARSLDGVTWTREAGAGPGGALFDIDPDAVYAAWPNAFFDGTRFILQYTAPSLDMCQYRTRVATSTDGRAWTKCGDLVWADGGRDYDSTGMITRHVLPNPVPGGRRWLMVYTATDAQHRRAIAAAESDDGFAWHHRGAGPIFTVGTPGAWDDYGVAVTRLVPTDGRVFLYYYGFQSLDAVDKPRGIGLAIGTSDLQDFTRVQ